MEAPQQIEATRLADYLDVLTRAVFQSGMSWRVVEAKWDGFREAFVGFEATGAALRREFRYLGETGAYYLLYVVREPVPTHEEWIRTHQAR